MKITKTKQKATGNSVSTALAMDSEARLLLIENKSYGNVLLLLLTIAWDNHARVANG
jgi:hypothetical protein